jgi:hypothetical protein
LTAVILEQDLFNLAVSSAKHVKQN